MAILKATRQYHNPMETMKTLVSNKPLFSEYDWKQAMNTGQLDLYSNALVNSDDIDLQDFYRSYNLAYGDTSTRYQALINETQSNRDNKVKRRIQKFDYNGNAIFEKDDTGNDVPVYEYLEMSDYEYNKRLIRDTNTAYVRNQLNERFKLMREESDNFVKYLGDIVGVPGHFVKGVYEGASDLGAFLVGIVGGIDGIFDENKDFFSGFTTSVNDYINNDDIRNWLNEQFLHFDYQFTHYMKEDASYYLPGEIMAGVPESLGSMIPSMLLGKGAGKLAGGLAKVVGATTKTASKVASVTGQVASQTAFYSSVVFTEDVNQQYEYFKSQGITPPSAQIMSSSAIKAALQYGVEFGLGKLFGRTGMDTLLYGTSDRGVIRSMTGKNLTQNAILRLVKDSAQEGLEESLQESTDFLIDAVAHWINEDFQEVKWNWETIGLAFLMGAISSVAMNSVSIVGTKKISTGNIKTTKSGEIVDGEFEHLGKFASWQYGYDMKSFAEAYNNIREAGIKIKEQITEGKNTYKAQAQFATAYAQATNSLKMILSLYGQVGESKFNEANEILKSITKKINEGKFDSNYAEKVSKTLEIDLRNLALENNENLKKKMLEKNMSGVEDSVKVGEEPVADKSTAEILSELQKTYGTNGPHTILVTKGGEGVVYDDGTLAIPKNLLLNGNSKLIMETVAERELADQLVEGIISKKHYYKNAINIITNLYSQWSGVDSPTTDEAIFTLIFDERFYEAILAVNEKITGTFLLRLNSLVKSVINEKGLQKKLFIKKINECRKRWIDAALHFYTNNLIADADEFVSSLDASQAAEFKKRLKMSLQLYNMGRDIILTPNKVNNNVWEFVTRRINNMNVDDVIKMRLLADVKNKTDSRIREKAIREISDYYDGAFMTLYDGKHYLSKTSFTNEIFNSWLEFEGLFVYQLFDEKYLTDSDKIAIGENITEESILQYRQKQLNKYNKNITLGYANGNIVLTSDNQDDGFVAMQSILRKQRGAIVTGEDLKVGDDKVSRKIATDLRSRNKWLKTLLSPTIVEDYMADWLTVDDVVNHPEYLSDAIQDIIATEYGRVDRITVYRFIANQLADDTDGRQSLVIRQDGTVMIGDMTNMNNIYLDGVELPSRGQYNLTKFVKEKYLTGILANVTVKFVNAKESTEYVDYEYRQDENGKYIRVFVNEIRVANTGNQNQMKFALAHEIQHALQIQLRMNQGIGSKPLDWFSDKIKTQIIKDVLTMSPELFADLEKSKRVPNNSIVIQRVNDYIYYGSGETQAMGLGGVGQLTFYPLSVTRKNGMTTITFKNGKSYSVKNEINSRIAAMRVSDSAQSILQKSYTKYDVPQASDENRSKMNKAGIEYGKKLIGKDKINSDEHQEFMYYRFGFNGTLEEFKNCEVIVVEIGDEQYAVQNTSQVRQIIENVKLRQENDKVRITLSHTQVKNIKSYEPLSHSAIGKIKITKSVRRGIKLIDVDLSELPQKVMSQQLDVVDPITGEVFEDYFHMQNLVPDFWEWLDKLFETGYSPEDSWNFSINDILAIFKDNTELKMHLYEYLYETWGNETDESLKEKLVNSIRPVDREKSIVDFMHTHGVTSEIKDFVNFDLYVYRYQTNSTINKNTTFVSVNFDVTLDGVSKKIPYYPLESASRDGYLIIGKIKLKDCLLMIPTETNNVEVLVSPDKIVNITSKRFAEAQLLDADLTPTESEIKLGNVSTEENYERRNSLSLDTLKEKFLEGIEDYRRSGWNAKEVKVLAELGLRVFDAIQKLNLRRKDNLQNVVGITEGKSDFYPLVDGLAVGESFVQYTNLYPELILHELLHVVTDSVSYDKDTSNILKTIFSQVKKATDIPYYGLIDYNEMIAELSNPDFRNFLSKQNVYITLLTEISRVTGENFTMRQLSGIEPVSALDAINKVLDSIFRDYGAYQSILSRNQALTNIDNLKDYGIYEGLLYSDGKQIKSKVSTISGILVLDSDSEIMVKIKKKLMNYLTKRGYDISSDEAIIKSIKSHASENPESFTKMMYAMNGFSDMSVQHILLGNQFVVFDNEISNYTIENVVKETFTKEIKKETSTEETVEVYSKMPKTRYKNDFIEVDTRPNKNKESFKNAIQSGRYSRITTRDIWKSKGRKPIKVITKKEANQYDLQLMPPQVKHKYEMREFLERRIYEINGQEKIIDIYAYYTPKTYGDKRRWTVEEELDTNIKYFVANKKGQKQLTMNPRLRRFLVASTGKLLDPDIQRKIENASLTVDDLEKYILKENADLTTFRLVAETVYDNEFILTPQDLKKYATDLGPKMAALYVVLKDTDFGKTIFDSEFIGELTIEKIDSIWNLAMQQSDYSNELLKYVVGYSLDTSMRKILKRKNLYDEDGTNRYGDVDAEVLDRQSYYQMMNLFNGTLESGAHAASLARFYTRKNMRRPGQGKWNVWGGKNYIEESTSKTIGEDKEGKESTKELEDTLGDEGQEVKDLIDALEYSVGNKTVNEIRRKLLDVSSEFGKFAFTAMAKIAKMKGESSSKATNYFVNYRNRISEMSEDELYEFYESFIKNTSDQQLRQIFFMANLSSESINVFENYTDKVKDVVDKVRSNSQFAQRIYRKLNTIKNNVAKNNWKYILKENSDILNEDLSIKETALKENVDGKMLWRTESEMETLDARLKEISTNAKNGDYDGSDRFNRYLQEKKMQQKIMKELIDLITKTRKESVTTKGTIKETIKYIPISYYDVDGENVIDVKDSRSIPKLLKDVLSIGFNKTLKSQVINLSLENEKHIVATLTELFDNNFVRLQEISEDEAIEFLEFFINNSIMSTDTEASRLAIQTESLLAAYFLARHRFTNAYEFSNELMEKVRQRLAERGTFAGQLLATEKFIKAMLDPNKTRAQNLSKELGMTLDDEDIENLNKVLKALQSNSENYKKEKKNFEATVLRKYKGTKRTLWSKLLTFERAMMLSNPGTWLRNLVSNIIVVGGNQASENIGKNLTNLFTKAFPKSKNALIGENIAFMKNTKDGTISAIRYQYKLDKTISEETKRFITDKFIASGLMKDTMNGLSKYNLDTLDHNPASDNILDMVARSIAQDIHRNEVFATGKFANSKTAEFVDKYLIGTIYKAISDDPFIKSRTKRYLGKILEEDFALAKREKPNLTFDQFVNTPDAKNNIYGISSVVSTAYAKAVNLAAADFMHSPNMISRLERFLRHEWSEGAWFAYKQIIPFAASSWAWCMEAMRYTPLGLANAIVKLAKLENTVAKADKAHFEGRSIVHSEFTRYIQTRNLGKGVIGTALFIIGMILASCGWAGLDEEDDGYKLFVGDVKIAIDDILASQSVMMGIAIISSAQKESDVADILSEICNQLFRDSILENVVSTFRYSSGVGDFLQKEVGDIPSQFIPNIFKSISSIALHRGVVYNDNKFLERLQKLALQLMPGSPAEFVGAKTQVDIYTGKTQGFFTGDFWESVISKFTPIDVSIPSMSENELEAVSLDIRKSSLTGDYTINDVNVVLSTQDKTNLNSFYGKLNDEDLTKLRNNRIKVRVKTSDGKYKELTYSQMNDEQKSAAFNSIMSNNSALAKIYILTSTGEYKYYASESEYEELRKLGVTQNVYRKTDKLKGFVKS